MLLWFVIAYWILSIGIGLYASSRVHSAKDFAIAGRHLPLPIVIATVFATWFGSETVLGIPAVFLKEGLHGVVADPFGSSLCLILVGLVFAAPLYRMNLLTIGDFYRRRFGGKAEALTSIAIVISYLGWVGAQISALGLVFNVLTDGMISKTTGMWMGSMTILVYVVHGGMWAVAITDFIQMIVIMVGMLFIGFLLSDQLGGVGTVIEHARNAGKFEFWPQADLKQMIAFFAAWITMMLGSTPQQDVFQRVQSSKTIKIAVWGSVIGGTLYFLFAFVPMFLAYSATLIDPNLVQSHINADPQMILPSLILQHAPLVAQVMFFGALLAAIMSCASATLLAPSVTFTENILKPMLIRRRGEHGMSDKQLLATMRGVTFIFTILVTLYAVNSKASIFKMVENAYQVTLVMAFIPLVCGLFWKRATNQGALFAIYAGLLTWLSVLIFADDPLIPAQLAGLIASALGMLIGSLIPQWIRDELPEHPRGYLHEHASHSNR
ncbi:MAG: sodium:solute symporter [Candidatus Methylopumilus sp.]|nr:sodium:solute symporter [Candidatus Methylopumilus sp.]NBW60755.1 sodium:solute symporter [Methylophilaceae bacterium]